MQREQLIDRIEEIQRKNDEKYQGHNESQLMAREEIADLFEEELRLPNILEAAVISIKICEKIDPPLTTEQESFFIAGFQECIKYLNNKRLNLNNKRKDDTKRKS